MTVSLTAATLHPQVPCPWAENGLVDQQILPVLQWCHRRGIRTLASCQGGPAEQNWAYIQFYDLAALDAFFVQVEQAVAADTALHGRVVGTPAAKSTDRWVFEVRTNGRDSRYGGEGPRLRGIARLPTDDLTALATLLQQHGTRAPS